MPYPYTGTQGFMKGNLISGTPDPNATRLRFSLKCNTAYMRSSQGNSFDVGTYVKPTTDTSASNQGQHYYHSGAPNIYANRWLTITLNRHPQHLVGAGGSDNQPDDPEWVNPTGGSPVHYYDGLTRFYLTMYDGMQNATCIADNYYVDNVQGEPDYYVSTVTATHSGPISGFANGRYEVTWAGPKNQSVSYAVRYSTQSMKANGFASGTDGGTVNNPNSDYVSTIWTSPDMPEQTGFYVAIQPVGQSSFTEVYIPAMNSAGAAPPPTSTNACDVNRDGTVNNTDVTLAVNAALGTASCVADLDGNGRCDVVDVQRVINASLGGACRVGQ